MDSSCSSIKWTKRGSGTCPQCKSSYSTAWKPKTCACGYDLGGHYVPKTKKPKLENPVCVLVTQENGTTIYSVKTSPRGDRCFVITDESGSFCHHPNCKDIRGITVTDKASNCLGFSCQHIKLTSSVTTADQQWYIDSDTLEKYPCDASTKEAIRADVVDRRVKGWPSVLKVATNVFVVIGPPSASSPIGYTHVVRLEKDRYRCTAKSCKTLANLGSSKQQKYSKLCFHQHVLLCALVTSTTATSIPSSSTTLSIPSSSTTPTSIPSSSASASSIPSSSTTATSIPSSSTTTTSIPSSSTTPTSIPSSSATASSIPSSSTTATSIPSSSTTPTSIPSSSTTPTSIPSSSATASSIPSSSTSTVDSSPLPSSEVTRQTTLIANINQSLPYEIPLKWLTHAKKCDSLTHLGFEEGGWPLVFKPDDTICRLCGSLLGHSKQHPGSRGNSVMMTNGNPFRQCFVKVKSCKKHECKALHQIWPVETGLFNICDKVLLGLEVLLEWRELFKHGVPISTAIESKLDAWIKQCPKDIVPSSSELTYLSRLLYNGFYFFEIITDRSLDDNICGLCGIIGEFYLGDGNEKNCCSLKGVKYD